jgi:hypothetical protein
MVLSSGNLFMSNNSTVGATVLTMTSGNIETGSNIWTNLSTSSGGVSGASGTSYIIGSLGRGMSTSAATTRKFEVGTSTGISSDQYPFDRIAGKRQFHCC